MEEDCHVRGYTHLPTLSFRRQRMTLKRWPTRIWYVRCKECGLTWGPYEEQRDASIAWSQMRDAMPDRE